MDFICKCECDDEPVAGLVFFVKVVSAPNSSSSVAEAMIGEVMAQLYGEEHREANVTYDPDIKAVPDGQVMVVVKFDQNCLEDYLSQTGTWDDYEDEYGDA